MANPELVDDFVVIDLARSYNGCGKVAVVHRVRELLRLQAEGTMLGILCSILAGNRRLSTLHVWHKVGGVELHAGLIADHLQPTSAGG